MCRNSSERNAAEKTEGSSANTKGSCCQQSGGSSTANAEEQQEQQPVVSVFEFFTSGVGNTKAKSKGGESRRGISMLGNCQIVEGGLPACVWQPHSSSHDTQHKIVF